MIHLISNLACSSRKLLILEIVEAAAINKILPFSAIKCSINSRFLKSFQLSSKFRRKLSKIQRIFSWIINFLHRNASEFFMRTQKSVKKSRLGNFKNEKVNKIFPRLITSTRSKLTKQFPKLVRNCRQGDVHKSFGKFIKSAIFLQSHKFLPIFAADFRSIFKQFFNRKFCARNEN